MKVSGEYIYINDLVKASNTLSYGSYLMYVDDTTIYFNLEDNKHNSISYRSG